MGKVKLGLWYRYRIVYSDIPLTSQIATFIIVRIQWKIFIVMISGGWRKEVKATGCQVEEVTSRKCRRLIFLSTADGYLVIAIERKLCYLTPFLCSFGYICSRYVWWANRSTFQLNYLPRFCLHSSLMPGLTAAWITLSYSTSSVPCCFQCCFYGIISCPLCNVV